MVLVSSADHTSASTSVHDRGRPSKAKPDESRSVRTFEAQAQRRGVHGDAQNSYTTRSTAESTTMPQNQALETPDHAQHVKKRAEENTWVITWTGEQLVETTQALDEPRHHTAKTVCVRRSQGETDALASSDAGEPVQLESASQRSV